MRGGSGDPTATADAEIGDSARDTTAGDADGPLRTPLASAAVSKKKSRPTSPAIIGYDDGAERSDRGWERFSFVHTDWSLEAARPA